MSERNTYRERCDGCGQFVGGSNPPREVESTPSDYWNGPDTELLCERCVVADCAGQGSGVG